MKVVELSIGKVEIADTITWGMQEEIRAAMLAGVKMKGMTQAEIQNLELDGAALLASRRKALEVCVKKITLTDGTEVAFSKEWMDNLSIEDGDKLYNAVNEVTTPAKK